MQPPSPPHATQYMLRMDFALSSSLTKQQVAKTGFHLSKGRKNPACASVSFPVFSKCHAVLPKALSCFRNGFHLSWGWGGVGGRTQEPEGEVPGWKASENRFIQHRRKIKISPVLNCLLSYQLKNIPTGLEGAWASRAEPLGFQWKKKPLSFKVLTFENHYTVYRSIRAGSVCPLGGIRVNNTPYGVWWPHLPGPSKGHRKSR